MSAWANFFVAEVGAAAVLAGLIFVGISINLQKIVAKRLLSRAAWVTLFSLMEVLVISSLMLIPHQPLEALGSEVGVIGLLCWIVMTTVTIAQLARSRQDGFVEGQIWYTRLAIISLSQLITLPFIVAGVMLLFHMESGIYWTVPGILFALLYALYMGWVLTIEVNR